MLAHSNREALAWVTCTKKKKQVLALSVDEVGVERLLLPSPLSINSSTVSKHFRMGMGGGPPHQAEAHCSLAHPAF